MTVNELVKAISNNQLIEINGDSDILNPHFEGLAENFIHSKNFEILAKRTVMGIFSKVDTNGKDYILIYYDDWKKDLK